MSGRPNLEQIRARNAIAAIQKYRDLKGKSGGDAVSGYPALIVNNGLLATLAFSLSSSGGHEAIANAMAEHLADRDLQMPAKLPATAMGLAEQLPRENSTVLRLATAEALAFLNYLKRFVKSGDWNGGVTDAIGR